MEKRLKGHDLKLLALGVTILALGKSVKVKSTSVKCKFCLIFDSLISRCQ